MPCLFVEDFPNVSSIGSEAALALYTEVADAAGVSVGEVEVHLGEKKYKILYPDGTLIPASDVHVYVEWTGRPFEVKVRIADAIDKFMKAHGLSSDITFRDSGPGTFFVNGKLIGKEPPPQNVEIAVRGVSESQKLALLATEVAQARKAISVFNHSDVARLDHVLCQIGSFGDKIVHTHGMRSMVHSAELKEEGKELLALILPKTRSFTQPLREIGKYEAVRTAVADFYASADPPFPDTCNGFLWDMDSVFLPPNTDNPGGSVTNLAFLRMLVKTISEAAKALDSE